MKLIFQTMLQRGDVEEQIGRFCEENALTDETELAYFLDVIHGVHTHEKELDASIARHAKGWTIERMPKVDLSIMRLSCYEMGHREDIPGSVSINEAVELAKKYGDDNSKSFVNGVLGKVFLDYHPDGEAPKTSLPAAEVTSPASTGSGVEDLPPASTGSGVEDLPLEPVGSDAEPLPPDAPQP